MSTRAVYGFKDERDIHHVYVHHDGYPTGAADKLATALKSGLAWKLPRYEADDFAAAFVASNKTASGGVRLTHGPDRHGDIEYYYIVSRESESGPLMLNAYNGAFDDVSKTTPFYSGTLDQFISTAEQVEERERADA